MKDISFCRASSGMEDGGQSGMCFVRNWQVSAVSVIVVAISPGQWPCHGIAITYRPPDCRAAPNVLLLKDLSSNKR